MKKPQSIMSIFNTAKSAKGHIRDLKESFRSRLAAFSSGRNRESQQELEADFLNVLEKWGIHSSENIGEVIFCLRLRLWIFTILPIGYGLILIATHSLNSLIIFLMLAIPCLFAILTTAWRIWVLKNLRFVPFTRWILSGFGLRG